MDLDDHWRNALDGTVFSAGGLFRVSVSPDTPFTRFDAARRLARDRRVLHVGCVDHLVLLDPKIASGTWMHEVLCSIAQTCGGIDVNAEGIAELRRRGYENLWVGDPAFSPEAELLAGPWDMLFLGEMLEHVDSPVEYLTKLRTTWEGKCRSIIVTVPNALSWSTIRSAIRSGGEVINTDHRYWFTPYTIAKVASRAGLEVMQLFLCEAFPVNDKAGILSRAKQRALANVLRRRPIFRSIIVAELSI